MLKLKKSTYIFAALGAIALLSLGCNGSKSNTLDRPAVSEDQNSNNSNTAMENGDDGEVAGEVTPLPTKKITVANQELTVEVADTDASRTQGLSDREKLDEGTGMLFDFTNTDFKKPGFWMKDMRISIDIIWIGNGKIIGIEHDVPLPPEDADLPVYYPPTEISHVLEVPAGWSKKNNIVVGETVSL
jgi:uncharacterized protein